MKAIRTIALICAIMWSAALAAQLPGGGLNAPSVKWSAETETVSDGVQRIVLTADIAAGRHMYDFGPYTSGPNPTVITFSFEGAEPEGGIEMLTRPERHYDKTFGTEIGSFSGRAQFAQRVRIASPDASATIAIEWMTCDETSCTPPEDTELELSLAGGEPAAQNQTAPQSGAAAQTASLAGPSDDYAATLPPATGRGSLWALIIEAVLWGFAALLTPCVFPMVPMTVSFFLKGEGGPARGRMRAALYGLFIVLLYTVPVAAIILITRVVGGDAVTADIFNWLATHWLPNIVFFAVFMIFAASFFGAFEITLPSRLVNKSDSKADTKGLGGIFFLALTLVLVSFSCTGPIVGSVLIKSTSGEFWSPIITMLAFSLAFALPFTLFALFPSMLKSLPKSGGWLNSVKVVIGFLEVALGFKFLSVADQTYHWGLLDREVYLAIWIAVFTLLTLYLLGKLHFAHDSQTTHIGVGRLALAIASLSFVVYMLPGMWGAPLKALSGYLPPMHTQDFIAGGYSAAPAPSTAAPAGVTAPGEGKYSDFLHLPHGLKGFFDLSEAQEYARATGKPVFVDFTGHGCVNCREMEERVWSAPEVLQLLRDEFVIAALYVDDKTVLPASEHVTTPSGKVLKSLGKINSHYALTTYGVNAQPYYVLLDPNDGHLLTQPSGRNLDPQAFAEFLRRGLAAAHGSEN